MRWVAPTEKAAALIGVVNRTTEILGCACERPDEFFIENADILAREFTISAAEFDPAECPEPTPEFEQSLSKIQGLEFLKGLPLLISRFFSANSFVTRAAGPLLEE